MTVAQETTVEAFKKGLKPYKRLVLCILMSDAFQTSNVISFTL